RGFTSGAADTYAIDVEGSNGVKVFVSDTTISNNTRGIGAAPPGTTTATVFLDNVKIDNNLTGIEATPRGTIWMNKSVVTENRTGVLIRSGGIVNSFRNNVVSANTNADVSGTLTAVGLK